MKLLLHLAAALVGLVVLSPAVAGAKVVSFPANNFSIDVPSDWIPSASQPMPLYCRMVASAHSSSNENQYSVMVMKPPTLVSPQAFIEGMQTPLTSKGLKTSPIRDETIGGTPFAVFTVSHENSLPFMLIATAFADDRIYMIQVTAPKGSIEKAPELNQVVQSFRFLGPVRSLSRHEVGQAHQNEFAISRDLGRIAGLLLGLALLVVFYKWISRPPG